MADWNTAKCGSPTGEIIDPEILPLCEALNAAGFVTASSCCGHGKRWPHVWFEHSTDERIEAMARFVMGQRQEDYRPFVPEFHKEILMEGYSWWLEIHLNNCYANTPVDVARKNAECAMAQVTAAIQAWTAREARVTWKQGPCPVCGRPRLPLTYDNVLLPHAALACDGTLCPGRDIVVKPVCQT